MLIFVPFILQATDKNDIQPKDSQSRQIVFKIYNRPVFDVSNESISTQDVKHNASPEITTNYGGEMPIKSTEKEKTLSHLMTLGTLASYICHPPIMIVQYVAGAVIYKAVEDSTSLLQRQYSYYFTTKKE